MLDGWDITSLTLLALHGLSLLDILGLLLLVDMEGPICAWPAVV